MCNVLWAPGKLVQCKLELTRGMDYLVEEYQSMNPLYPSNDFILLKEKDNTNAIGAEISPSKEKSVDKDRRRF